ncbi:MAG: hypothetical protein WEB57_04465 [Pseudohongiellaceae bacterium]
MSAQQYRQTQSPEEKSRKARQDECEVKQRMTTHWDLDYLSREELEAEMEKGFSHDGSEPRERASQVPGEDEDTGSEENPLRIGMTLLAASAAMMVGAVLLLQSGGS